MSSSHRYSIVEPHPSVVPSKSYVYAGRGGAGNVTRVPSSVTTGPSATGPAARASVVSLSKPRSTFASGRGGAGNMHSSSERAIFSFDEELERQLSREHIAPVYHVGRGGAGNAHSKTSNTTMFATRRDSDSSARSSSSAESGADVATRKIRQGLRKLF